MIRTRGDFSIWQRQPQSGALRGALTVLKLHYRTKPIKEGSDEVHFTILDVDLWQLQQVFSYAEKLYMVQLREALKGRQGK